MNKANELHRMADNHHTYQEQFDEIIKLCAKSAFSGFYNCAIHKDRLKGAEHIILQKLLDEGLARFRRVYSFASDADKIK